MTRQTHSSRLLSFLLRACVGVFALSLCAQPAPPPPLTADLLFTHARLLDGSGNPWRWADVAVRGDRIVFVGDAQHAKMQAHSIMDLHGLYLAPGFIDLHTHTAGGLSDPTLHENLNYLMQGVTTVATGNDGGSPWPIQGTLEKWEKNGIGTNAALFSGFGTVRQQVLGAADRAPNAEELDRERALMRQGMREGAIGMSTGLFYVPQSFSKTDEVIALAKVAAEFGGIYDSHLRDEDSYNIGVKGAVAEAIEIGRQAHLPIMISHIKALGPGAWGQSRAIVDLVLAARVEGIQVVANQYPYTASGTALEAAVIPNWATEGGRAKMLERLANAELWSKLLREVPELIAKRGGAESLTVIGFRPSERSGAAVATDVTREMVVNKDLAQIAQAWSVSPAEAALRIVRAGGTSVVSHNMKDDDVAEFMKQDWVATGSDGTTSALGQLTHPRSFGTFVLKLEKYVVQDKLISLPFAIRAATSLPASIAGFTDRGVVASGYFADLVVFDLAKVHSPATYENPAQYGQGFVHILVNGQFAVRDGQPTHALAGRVLRGPGAGSASQ